jgi:hypothetical protein
MDGSSEIRLIVLDYCMKAFAHTPPTFRHHSPTFQNTQVAIPIPPLLPTYPNTFGRNTGDKLGEGGPNCAGRPFKKCAGLQSNNFSSAFELLELQGTKKLSNHE